MDYYCIRFYYIRRCECRQRSCLCFIWMTIGISATTTHRSTLNGFQEYQFPLHIGIGNFCGPTIGSSNFDYPPSPNDGMWNLAFSWSDFLIRSRTFRLAQWTAFTTLLQSASLSLFRSERLPTRLQITFCTQVHLRLRLFCQKWNVRMYVCSSCSCCQNWWGKQANCCGQYNKVCVNLIWYYFQLTSISLTSQNTVLTRVSCRLPASLFQLQCDTNTMSRAK